MKRIAVCFLFLAFLFVFSLPAQETTPEPYEEKEFPAWMWNLRRGEIICIGSFPFTMFFTNIGFQIVRYFQSDLESEFVPVPFGGVGTVSLEEGDKKRILITAVSLSAAIAVSDFIIGKILDRDERQTKAP